MSQRSSIEWTDATWNPIRGCSRVSEGCRNCYAERVAARFSAPGQPYEGLAHYVVMTKDVQKEFPLVMNEPHWTGDVRLIESVLGDPLRWRKPRRVFVNSMSDLFHEKVLTDELNQIFAAMLVCPQHTFQILTKRPERMKAYLCNVGARDIEPHMQRLRAGIGRLDWPWRNIWLGVSVEDQATADERIPLLLQTPAAVRFVSYEPALGPVDFTSVMTESAGPIGKPIQNNVLTGQWWDHLGFEQTTVHPRWTNLNWLICGGESGPGARPMHPQWARNVRDQCRTAGVPFFFKQWGEYLPIDQWPKDANGKLIFSETWPDKTYEGIDLYATSSAPFMRCVRVGKRRAGALLDGCEYHEFPPRNPRSTAENVPAAL